MTRTHKFRQEREAPPGDAEKHPASNFQRTVKSPSKYVPGADVVRRVQTCPSCASDVEIEHGDRVVCDCGLHMEIYGNALTIWRIAPPKD